MPMPFHVYAIDGFESAHRTQSAAERAAKRGSKLRGIEYRVVRCSAHGLTGGGQGTAVSRWLGGEVSP